MTEVFLSVSDVAAMLGVVNASKYELPEPDALIGSTRGWKPETIEAWNLARPGKGVGGGRPKKPVELM